MWPLFPPPGQRAPEFFTEQNGGRPMTRAMEQGMDAPARSFCSGRTLCSAGGSARRNKPKTPTTRNPMCSARPNAKLDSSDDSAAIDHAVIPANARPRPARMSWPRLRIHSATSSSSAPKISRMSWPTFRAHAFSLRVTNRAKNIRVVLFGATLEALDPLPRQARHPARRPSRAPACETCHFRVGDAKSAVPGPTFRSSPKTLDGNLWRALRRLCLPCHWRSPPTAPVPYWLSLAAIGI